MSTLHKSTRLVRSLSLFQLTFYGVGTILGAGIYVLIGKVAGEAGYYAPWAFMMSAVIVSFSAFSYGQLSRRFPQSAGEAVYIKEGLQQSWLAIWTGWAIVFTGIVSAATISRGFVGYLALFVDLPQWLVITLLVLILGLIATRNVGQAVGVAVIITIVEIIGVVLVIAVGWPSLQEQLPSIEQAPMSLVPPFKWAVWQGIGFGAFLAFYAYIGFEDMVNMAEEVKNPRRNLPLSITIALIVSTLLYVAVATVAVAALPLEQLAISDAPFAEIVSANSSIPVFVIGGISLVAVVNGALVQIIMGARVLYGMACRGLMPGWLCPWFSKIHQQRRTPTLATLFMCLLVLGFALWLPITSLARLTSSIILCVFALVNLSLVALLLRKKVRVLQVAIPVTGFVLCLLFLGMQFS